MPLKTINVTIDEKGSVQHEYSNFPGTECLTVARQLNTFLAQYGVQIEQTSMTPKPELLAALNTQQVVSADFGVNHEVGAEG